MNELIINWWFTLIWALIGFIWTFWVFHMQKKSKEKDKIIYYYSILNKPSIVLSPSQDSDLATLLYKKTNDKKYLSGDKITKWQIKDVLEKYL